MTQAKEERTLDLLVARATEGLDPTAEQELEVLLAQFPELDEDPSFDLAAASIDVAYTMPQQPMPENLRNLVAAQASDFFESRSFSTEQQSLAVADEAESDKGDEGERDRINDSDRVVSLSDHRATATRPQPETTLASDSVAPDSVASKSLDTTRWLGWLAAAAVLLVAIMTRASAPIEPDPSGPTSTIEPSTLVETAVEPTPAQVRQTMLARATDVIQLDWTATDDPAAQTGSGTSASGDVVWSSAAQTGYMRFSGLAVNDPGVYQYQLWIFDAEQDERYPIDGGVFDIANDGETVIRIDPKLRVVSPTLFAITVEKPGGVVVSSRERLPLLAKVS